MAYLNKYKKKDSKKDNLNHQFYNTVAWRNCRMNYLVTNPLCEICKQNNKITLAVEVHHIKPISTVRTLQEKYAIGLDINNLQALCNDCHHEIHNYNRKNIKKND